MAHPPRLKSEATTRWQGTMCAGGSALVKAYSGNGFRFSACPASVIIHESKILQHQQECEPTAWQLPQPISRAMLWYVVTLPLGTARHAAYTRSA